MINYRIPFGSLKIGEGAKRRVNQILDSNWISEGHFVREFEEKFAAKFGWKHAIATSSGTDAGIVVWSAVKELCYGAAQWEDAAIVTPACAFVATANCLLASKIWLRFVDIDIDTLNMSPATLEASLKDSRLSKPIGIQFVATMGKPTPIQQIAEIAVKNDLRSVGDFCEAHGAQIEVDTFTSGRVAGYADHFCDAAIYSFYAAHLIVGGEGGCICTNDDEIAELCRSIKSHGRPPGSNYFDFQRVGFNAKWNDLCAAVALESLEKFDENFAKRREVRRRLIEVLLPMEDDLILYRDGLGEVISPHAFPVVLRDENSWGTTKGLGAFYKALDDGGIQCKTLFGSLPTQHAAFSFLGYRLGDFPVAERIGGTGLHLPCNEFMTDDDIAYIADRIGEFFRKEKP